MNILLNSISLEIQFFKTFTLFFGFECRDLGKFDIIDMGELTIGAVNLDLGKVFQKHFV